jgi:hypothetical protein
MRVLVHSGQSLSHTHTHSHTHARTYTCIDIHEQLGVHVLKVQTTQATWKQHKSCDEKCYNCRKVIRDKIGSTTSVYPASISTQGRVVAQRERAAAKFSISANERIVIVVVGGGFDTMKWVEDVIEHLKVVLFAGGILNLKLPRGIREVCVSHNQAPLAVDSWPV